MFCVEEKNENLNYLVVEESLNANPDFNIVMNFKPEEDSLKINLIMMLKKIKSSIEVNIILLKMMQKFQFFIYNS